MPWAAGGGINYLLRDMFTTDAVAPLTTPRTCEPGPGTLTLTDTGNSMSIASSALTASAGASAWGNPGGYGGLLARTTGRAVLCSMSKTATTTFGLTFGWINNTRNDPDSGDFEAILGFRNAATIMPVRAGNTYMSAGVYTSATTYQMAVVLRSTGYFALIKGGAFTNWTLIWVGSTGATASLRPSFADYDAAWTMDDMRAVDLGGSFATDYGLALTRTTSPTNPQTATGAADGVIEVTWTAATSETLELSFRRTDDDNRWIVRCAQAGTIKIIERNGGVDTERATAAATFTNAAVYRIVATFDGVVIRTFVQPAVGNGTTGGVYGAASFNATATGIASSGGATTADLICWPRTVTMPNV